MEFAHVIAEFSNRIFGVEALSASTVIVNRQPSITSIAEKLFLVQFRCFE